MDAYLNVFCTANDAELSVITPFLIAEISCSLCDLYFDDAVHFISDIHKIFLDYSHVPVSLSVLLTDIGYMRTFLCVTYVKFLEG